MKSIAILFASAGLVGTSSLQAEPVISVIVNAASYQGTLAPGCWATLYGLNLGTSESAASSVPLPSTLGGISLSVAGIAAPLGYVSTGQINFLVPFEVTIPANSVVPVKVTALAGTSAEYNLRLVPHAPALFTRDASGTGPAHVFDQAFQPVQTVAGGSTIILYATGLGPTTPPARSDTGGASVEPFNRISDPVDVYVGDAKAQVLFAGLAPGFPGVYQVNVKTAALLSGRTYLRNGAWQSNVAEVAIATGANVANVIGAIDGLYPLTLFDQRPLYMPPWKTTTSFSAMPMAGMFSTAFDIRPDAKPFSVVAASEAAQALIFFDPPAGSYAATITVPGMPARNGDFSRSEFHPLLDFVSCRNAVCNPFPNSVIPGARTDPLWSMVARLMPTPNVPSEESGSMAIFAGQGPAPAGSRFVIDLDNHPELSIFGGFLQISPGAPKTRSTAFRLYVDGRLIASKDATYDVLQGP